MHDDDKFRKKKKIKQEKNDAFPYFYLNICKNEPYILVNRFFESSDIYFNSVFLVPDYIFKIENILRSNEKYGSIENDTKSNFKNTYSRNKFWISVEKSKKTKIFIDWEKLKKIKNEMKNELNIKNDSEISIEKILLSYSQTKNPDNSKKLYDLLQYSILLVFEKKFIHTSYIYLIEFYDFRGRKYYDSIISPTNYKLFRFMFFFGYYNQWEIKYIIKKSLETEASKIVYEYWDDSLDKKNLTLSKDKNTEKYKKIILIQFYVSIGVIFKSKILQNKEITKNGYSFDFKEFINQGVREIEEFEKNPNSVKNLSIDDRLKFESLYYKIKNPFNIKKKETISFDFSCSGHQLRYLYLSPEDKKTYIILNTDGKNNFTDIYSYIIENFKKNKQEKNDIDEDTSIIINNYFNRKLLKKSIMTGEYSVKIPKFIEYYRSSLLKEYKEGSLIYNSKKNTIIKLLTELYSFTNNLNKFEDFKCIKIMDEVYIQYKKNGFVHISNDKFQVNLGVFKKENAKRIYLNIKSEKKTIRLTAQTIVYSDKIDEKKTKSSFTPNLIHSMDSEIVREVTILTSSPSPYSYISIHDEYWLPYQESLIFKDLINKIINKKFTKNSKNYNICIIN